MSLLLEVETGLRLVSYAPGRIEFEPAESAAPELAARLSQRLKLWTGVRWGVSVVSQGGAQTIAEARAERKGDLVAQAREHPLVQAVLAAFPGAEIKDVRLPATGEDAPPPAVDDDDWDPFDPFEPED
jgi:DNA polymerase-3 subunit gamma/tau